MMIYIGSDQPLRLVAWDEASPSFHVEEIASELSGVRAQFDVQHVYYAGSHQGCGCGFQLGEYPGFDDEEAPAKRRSLQQLADYLGDQVANGRRVQLFACWAGGEQTPPRHRRTIAADDLRGDEFYFLDGELVDVAT